jgi:hypothetical protein
MNPKPLTLNSKAPAPSPPKDDPSGRPPWSTTFDEPGIDNGSDGSDGDGYSYNVVLTLDDRAGGGSSLAGGSAGGVPNTKP